jgi:hypothetical protein
MKMRGMITDATTVLAQAPRCASQIESETLQVINARFYDRLPGTTCRPPFLGCQWQRVAVEQIIPKKYSLDEAKLALSLVQ